MKFRIETKKSLIERYEKKVDTINHIKKLSKSLKEGKKVYKKVDISKKRKQFLLLFDEVENMTEMGKRLKLGKAALYTLFHDLKNYETDKDEDKNEVNKNGF